MKPKRKLTDLKPDECIGVINEKQYTKIKRLIRENGMTYHILHDGYYGVFIKREGSLFEFMCDSSEIGNPYTPEPFFSSKKSTRKMVKELKAEVAELRRIVNMKPVDSVLSHDGNGSFRIHIKETDLPEPTPIDQPFVLPEKWCVKRTSENYKIINNWANKVNGRIDYTEIMTTYLYIEDCDVYDCYYTPPEGYTEITTEQFIKHVLKREEEEIAKLEVGKWYKSSGGALNYKGEIYDYGFNSKGGWVYDNYWFNQEPNWKPATPQEVEEALKEEAKKQGHPNTDLMIWEDWNNQLYINIVDFGKKVVFDNGIWATIVQQPKEIDFSIAGQLVESNEGYIVETTGLSNGSLFSGVVKKDKVPYKKGFTSNAWDKESFKIHNK